MTADYAPPATGEHRLTSNSLDHARSQAARWSAEDPTEVWSVSQRTVRQGGCNVPTYFVHRGAAPRSFHKHDRWLAGKNLDAHPSTPKEQPSTGEETP
jgi:hypothetical protein